MSVPGGKTIVSLAGNAQAAMIAARLRALADAEDRYDIRHASGPDPEADIVYVQVRSLDDAAPVAQGARTRTFPALNFTALWPLSSMNPCSVPGEGFPHGRFPFGNGYVLNSARQGAPPEEILAFCIGQNWPKSFPDPDGVLRAEQQRLKALDAACDIHVADFIFEHFATARLFYNPSTPSDILICHLATQISRELGLPEVVPVPPPPARALPAVIEVPIHPALARHYGLQWFDEHMPYNYFGSELSAENYFKKHIAHTLASLAEEPVLVIYGNCQAEVLASAVSKARERAGFRMVYLRSFDEPGAPGADISTADVARCRVLWEQHDENNPFPRGDWLPPQCNVIKFPALDFNALWPFTCVNRNARPQPPKYPFGKFPYGDRVLFDLLEQATIPEQALYHYHRRAHALAPDPQRFLELEAARLHARDAKCDVRMADYVLEHFRQTRLFWTVNHPASALIAELLRRLCERSGPPFSSIDAGSLVREAFGGSEPLGVSSVPIHPNIAETYGLTWYSAENERFQNWGDVYSYEGYFEALAADAMETAEY